MSITKHVDSQYRRQMNDLPANQSWIECRSDTEYIVNADCHHVPAYHSDFFRPFLTKPLTKYRVQIRCITDQIQSEGQLQTMPKLEKHSKFTSKSQTSFSVNYTLCFNQKKWLSVNRESYDSRIQISGHSTMSQTTSSLSKSRSSKCHRDTRVKNHGLQLLLLFPVRRSQCIRSSQATWKQRVHKFFG